jgi:hypothetical protein
MSCRFLSIFLDCFPCFSHVHLFRTASANDLSWTLISIKAVHTDSLVCIVETFVSCLLIWYFYCRLIFHSSQVFQISQQSLLNLSGAPLNEGAVPGWAARVRDRVRVIAKNINTLEIERQHLLSMLWDAGLGDLELTQLEGDNSDARKSHVSHPLSVIDLMSEESYPPTPVIESPVGPMKPRFSDASLENDENIANLNSVVEPAETVPTSPKNVVEVTKECSRVFRPDEWRLMDFSKLDADKLKLCMTAFGLKSSGGKNHMINHLKRIFEYACGESLEVPEGPQSGTKEEMFDQFNGLIQGNYELYEKIILFESVELSNVFEFLQNHRSETWKHFSLNAVREYLDSVGVQYSNTAGNERNKKRKKINVRVLRKSISCP